MAKRRAIDDVLAPVSDDTAAAAPASAGRPTAKRGSGKRAAPRKSTQRRSAAPQTPDSTEQEAERDKRLNVPLTAAELRALQAARLDDGVPAAARVRAMIRLWQASQDVREQVDSTAHRGR